MLPAYHFECIAAPAVAFRFSLDLLPLVAAALRPFCEKSEIKKRIEIKCSWLSAYF